MATIWDGPPPSREELIERRYILDGLKDEHPDFHRFMSSRLNSPDFHVAIAQSEDYAPFQDWFLEGEGSPDSTRKDKVTEKRVETAQAVIDEKAKKLDDVGYNNNIPYSKQDFQKYAGDPDMTAHMRAENKAWVDSLPRNQTEAPKITESVEQVDLKPEHLDARQHFEYPLRNGKQMTPEERDFYDYYKEEHRRKTISAENPNGISRPTRIFTDQEFRDFETMRADFNKNVEGIANQLYPNAAEDGDIFNKKKDFIRKFKQSYGHILPKGDRRFAHLSDVGSNAMTENWWKNWDQKAHTTLGDFVNGVAKNIQSGKIGMDPDSLVQINSILDALEKAPGDFEIAGDIDELRKYYNAQPIKSDIITGAGVLDTPITDEKGRPIIDTSLEGQGNRAVTEAILGSSNAADTTDTIRNPDGHRGIETYVTGSPHSRGFQPGGTFALTTSIDDFIDESVKTGTKIDSGELFRFIREASPEKLTKLLGKYPHIVQQMGKADVRLLAAMAVGGVGVTAILPLVDPENREAFVSATMEAGGQLGDAWQGMTDAGMEAIPGSGKISDAWKWWRDKTEAGSTYRGGSGWSSILPGVNTHINNVVGFLGEEIPETVGMFMKAIEIKDAGANSDIVPNVPGILQPNQFQEQIDTEQLRDNRELGLLSNRWT